MIVINEIVNNKDFEKSDFEIETYESIEELKYPQEYKYNSIIILDDLNDKEMNNPPVQVMLKRSRHKNLSIVIISQDYYELSKKHFVLMVISIIYSNQTILEMY